ncbi:shikimate dehydrogenase [Bacillus coahuilensis p1.1.43]|uniref:Shikimate dehydrogenase (NADP(+)) n=1 Tax=Bacillus coahuilensis p1.1.43 TaxID=1150625 RepID=A0A147K7I5_9BACI|nr:shikimate dehydrogenase [Bacillus coahuilensis]KUP06056.1 shikimate dehydrogenase [Bacillus coahuilensis p1.1.43]
MATLYGVIGDPIGHSLSPTMHNATFLANNIDAFYAKFHVTSEHLEDAIKGMKALGIKGFNVTIPHKETIIPMLDEVDLYAMRIGAVNTVVNENGKLVGYNTDGPGFVCSLKELTRLSPEHNVLIIGAGGAAKGIIYALLESGLAKIDVCNRSLNKAQELLITVKQMHRHRGHAMTIVQAESNLDQYDIVIQTTSVGMYPNVDVSPIKMNKIKEQAACIDIIYNPDETLFLKNAKSLGAFVQNGLGMFVNQGALSFAKWTGIDPEIEIMKQAIVNNSEESKC